jgi:hypothetical protein
MKLAKRSAPVNAVAERERDFLTKGLSAAISRSLVTRYMRGGSS